MLGTSKSSLPLWLELVIRPAQEMENKLPTYNPVEDQDLDKHCKSGAKLDL